MTCAPRWPGGPSVCTWLRHCSVLGLRVPFTAALAACLSPSLSPSFLSISSLVTINKGKKPKTNLNSSIMHKNSSVRTKRVKTQFVLTRKIRYNYSRLSK